MKKINLDKLHSVHGYIHTWYKKHGRHHLPWRNTEDAYAIYISEIMLQQTQVNTVLERYYTPFLTRFPTLTSLAHAPLDDVLKQWEGLGYYTRARNLHKTAEQIYRTGLPNDIEQLNALPGIGKNTAHAIASFAFKQPVPIMEANVKRILCRVFTIETPNDNILWDIAYELVDKNNNFDYNQALMDIGSTICTRTKPLCLTCPLESVCKGKTAPLNYPTKKFKKPTPTRKKDILLYRNNNGHYWTKARTSNFLGGLYGFDEHDRNTLDIDMHQPLGNITQTYSHFTLDANIYLTVNAPPPEKGEWHPLDTLRTLPLSGADIKIITLIEKVLSTS